ncbi:MAG: hypothetical protein GC204_18935 [Chloroflexi bacterium]|nr:hypothetical protein [Chloroflexota bacterium]
MQPTMTATRSAIVKADQARVWQAITEATRISQWFDSHMQWEFEPQVGAKITFYYEGKAIGNGRIVTVEAQERFAFHWTPEPGNPVESLVTFVLENVPEGTRVTITEAGFEALPETLRQKRYEMNDMGWGIALDRLTAYLQADDHV